MDVDNRKVYGDTSITDGLVYCGFSNSFILMAASLIVFKQLAKTQALNTWACCAFGNVFLYTHVDDRIK